MNTRTLVAASLLSLMGATSAFAGDEFDPLTGFGVQAKPAATQKAAPARPAASSVIAPATSASGVAPATGLTREQVKAEFLRSRAEGGVPSFDVGTEYARAPAGAPVDREAVRAEARAALRGAKSGS